MIDRLAKISSRLYWLKPIGFIFSSGFLLLFGYSVLFRSAGEMDVYLIPSILGTLWSLLLISIIYIFPNVPSVPSADVNYIDKVKIRLKRSLYYLMGLIFLVLSIAIILLSLKMLGIWQGNN